MTRKLLPFKMLVYEIALDFNTKMHVHLIFVTVSNVLPNISTHTIFEEHEGEAIENYKP